MSTSRVRFHLLEATFTFLFFARVEFEIEYLFDDILPWKREDVPWQPGCSHSALMERPRGLFDMNDEQVIAYKAERQKRAKERQAIKALRKHLASKAHLEQVRLAEGGAPKVVSADTARCRKFSAKHKAAKTYYCPVCDRAFNIKGHLKKHKKHLAKVAAAAATENHKCTVSEMVRKYRGI
ncbi:hypothetical protein CSHISOI_00471 [Colletotrichum shisoi]|uniref:C2H2-type domain-containing protein n=1 Tax=Colletotrichum shisoi TaxID=2078593 RepID=A0A5Q4C7R5_9PEZI|nr:hypothetical protein CSHISOI_00471 [Colletotrichum shisoi]